MSYWGLINKDKMEISLVPSCELPARLAKITGLKSSDIAGADSYDKPVALAEDKGYTFRPLQKILAAGEIELDIEFTYTKGRSVHSFSNRGEAIEVIAGELSKSEDKVADSMRKNLSGKTASSFGGKWHKKTATYKFNNFNLCQDFLDELN